MGAVPVGLFLLALALVIAWLHHEIKLDREDRARYGLTVVGGKTRKPLI